MYGEWMGVNEGYQDEVTSLRWGCPLRDWNCILSPVYSITDTKNGRTYKIFCFVRFKSKCLSIIYIFGGFTKSNVILYKKFKWCVWNYLQSYELHRKLLFKIYELIFFIDAILLCN